MTATQTAEALRSEARAARQRSAESWDRSDTDGFLSQAAADTSALRLEAQADIVDAGGVAEFTALFDLEGNLVPAKFVKTRFGMAWGILPSDDPDGRFVRWFNPSQASKGATRLRNDNRKGYTEGTIKAPAKAVIADFGRIAIVRTDGGFSRDVEIVTTVSEFYSVDL